MDQDTKLFFATVNMVIMTALVIFMSKIKSHIQQYQEQCRRLEQYLVEAA